MVRHMLGAVNEFVAASAKERLSHGRATSLQDVADDPEGPRSLQGDPKLGGPAAILEDDPVLKETMQIYAAMPAKQRPTYAHIAAELKKQTKKWTVQKKGKGKGNPWSSKQICFFLARLGAIKLKKTISKAKGKVTADDDNNKHDQGQEGTHRSSTKDQKEHNEGRGGIKGGCGKARQETKPPKAHKLPSATLPLAQSSRDGKSANQKHGKPIGKEKPRVERGRKPMD